MAEQMGHTLVRTSPKGTPFVGRCTSCGERELSFTDAARLCDARETTKRTQAAHLMRKD